jgi:uncharacterized membrane protein
MDQLIVTLSIVAIVGSAAVAGVFLAFSSFIMKALDRLPTAEGMAAMQSINVTVYTAFFMGPFVGTAVLSVGAVVLGVTQWGQSGALFLLLGGVAYAVGTLLVTGLGNVPLNEELAALPTDDPTAESVWRRYVSRWTMLNHVRTAAATLAAVCYCMGLLRFAAG